MFSALDISSSALTAQRIHMDVIAGNIANKDATRDETGRLEPYRRRVPLFATGRASNGAPGVRVEKIVQDPSPFHMEYEPDHPDAVPTGKWKGYVRTPNVDLHAEMVNMMVALRAYEANVSVIETIKSMATTTLQLIG